MKQYPNETPEQIKERERLGFGLTPCQCPDTDPEDNAIAAELLDRYLATSPAIPVEAYGAGCIALGRLLAAAESALKQGFDTKTSCPKTHDRIGHLINPKTLDDLTDFFEELGMPLGSDNWADIVLCRLNEMRAAEHLLRRLEVSWDDDHRNEREREHWRRKRQEYADAARVRREARNIATDPSIPPNPSQ